MLASPSRRRAMPVVYRSGRPEGTAPGASPSRTSEPSDSLGPTGRDARGLARFALSRQGRRGRGDSRSARPGIVAPASLPPVLRGSFAPLSLPPCPRAGRGFEPASFNAKSAGLNRRSFNSRMAGPTGLEPATSGVTGLRSNQLSYDPISKEQEAEYTHLLRTRKRRPDARVRGAGEGPALQSASLIPVAAAVRSMLCGRCVPSTQTIR